ncbi:MAG: hypothetical protein K2Y27_05745 [Xanthobacteraceae bacterium]|nr:hypothetical protein [Xanthobacteraceae bacterium]
MDTLLHVLAKAMALFRRAGPAEAGIGGLVRHVRRVDVAAGRSNSVVLAVDPPIAFGDVVVGTHLHPGDKHRVHEALQLAARRQAA